MFNILLSSAGRQSFLVKEFHEALNGRGSVFASDFNRAATSLKAADKGFVTPAFTDSEYINCIVELCKLHAVSLLISLNTDDLLILELNRSKFDKIGCQLVGGPIDSIKTTLDKYQIYNLCKKLGLPAVKTWLPEDLKKTHSIKYPLIAKPRFGKGSRGQKIIKTEVELQLFLKDTNKSSNSESYIFQEFLNGQEFGFDLINNFNGEFAGILARKKYAMKNGETDTAISEKEDKWLNFGQLISKTLKHQGIIDMDAIIIKDKPFLIDINFRFGGGYAFSHLAGANIPKVYVSWALNESVKSEWLKAKQGILCQRKIEGVTIVTKG